MAVENIVRGWPFIADASVFLSYLLQNYQSVALESTPEMPASNVVSSQHILKQQKLTQLNNKAEQRIFTKEKAPQNFSFLFMDFQRKLNLKKKMVFLLKKMCGICSVINFCPTALTPTSTPIFLL